MAEFFVRFKEPYPCVINLETVRGYAGAFVTAIVSNTNADIGGRNDTLDLVELSVARLWVGGAEPRIIKMKCTLYVHKEHIVSVFPIPAKDV